jgi:hypothetical protein
MEMRPLLLPAAQGKRITTINGTNAATRNPILRRGDMELFLTLWALLGFSFWLFGAYPIGGWSHSAFHLCIAFIVPRLLMVAAIELPASQGQLKVAAQCAIIAKQSLKS